jgi:hypothetical protein
MPANGEEFERVDHQSYAGDGPQTKEHDRIDDYLSTRLEHTEVEKRKTLGWVTHYVEDIPLEGNVRHVRGGGTACISHLVMCRHDATVSRSDRWEPRV